MIVLDYWMLLGVAAVIVAVSKLAWALRRRP